MVIKAIFLYFLIINIIGYSIMGFDKSKSRRDKWRVSEKNLFAIAFLGGALGMLLGMRTFRHKTNKRKFQIGIPVLSVLNLAVYIYLYIKAF
ncbi:DUF1294 domain-containing protein [Lutispora sp.]|uniref:DUF1294 domain-containing protein n=1 Tax=Lutispora sp. TaxID=2828727 RepID=UPI000ECF5A10|nr:DUF1294 domain-containing protein [Lutispora sp.]MEA4961153.1 DUF1294 domain-containing protein [Lutispora sp.]HCJ58825.1 DUF1294 domain-containing protein [Clostridiaceae bacterium]